MSASSVIHYLHRGKCILYNGRYLEALYPYRYLEIRRLFAHGIASFIVPFVVFDLNLPAFMLNFKSKAI